jgi:translin
LSLKEMINKFRDELERKSTIREDLFSTSRKITFLSKQSIMAIHRDDFSKAKEKLSEAGKLLKKMNELTSIHQELITGSMSIAHQEYAEAQIFLKIVENNTFPTPHEINIPTTEYLLGLADAIGEFRRRALNSLRKNKPNLAETSLQIMENIYSELVSLEGAYRLIPELRRKCDIARRLIELTMGELATETRRRSLEKAIHLLEKKITVKKDTDTSGDTIYR